MLKILEHTNLRFKEKPEISGSNKNFELESKTEAENIFKLTSWIKVKEETRIERLTHIISIGDIKAAKYFTSKQEFKKLSKPAVITAFEFLHLELITTAGDFLYLYNHKPFTVEVVLKSNTLFLEIIHDAPFLHTTWDYSKGQRASSAAPVYKEGTKFEASFIVQKSKERLNSGIMSYNPSKTKACFVLTDHCDHDTIEKISVFLNGNDNNGWLNKNLKITKGVFRYSPKSDEIRKSDDLEVNEYKQLVDMLYKDGSEICPHALKHSGQITGKDFIDGLEYLKSEYKPKTWIDHGSYLKYCYSQNGHLNPEFKMTKMLKEFSYNNLWSFHDIALDPSLNLNFFHPKKYSRANGIKFIMKHAVQFNFLYSAHYFRSYIHKSFGKSLVTDYLNYFFATTKNIFISKKKDLSVIKFFFQKLSRFKEFRSSVKEPFTLKELNKYLPPLFTVNYQTINNWNDELLFFNTIETTHTKDIYTPKLLNQLIEDRGLHLGHTYILNSLSYINGIFDSKSKTLRLSKEWIEFIQYLSEKIKSNEVWNPNMGELVDRVKSVLNMNYYLLPEGIRIVNNNDHPVQGFKFILSNGRELIADVPANGSVILNNK